VQNKKRLNIGASVNKAYAKASRTAVTTSHIVLPGTPQYWLGRIMSEGADLIRIVIILAAIL
jgi:hypothetical protein